MDHPIRLTAADDLRRSRLTVFFRPILAIPLVIWLYAWSIVAVLALVASWVVTLVAGRTPRGLHDFLAAYLRFTIHVYAYLTVEASPYPGFLGESGYPVDVEVDPPAPQNRWTVAFRFVLAIPAAIVSAILGYALPIVGVFNWVLGVLLGRVHPGVAALGRYALRFTAQANGYMSLLTSRYPDFTPSA
ncbi:MAG: DUF4389 domain-containing protein [Actinomycetota bacterium]